MSYVYDSNDSDMANNIICSKCKLPIEGRYIRVDGKIFHPDCFTCQKCGLPIKGEYSKHKSKYYHPDCYKKVKGLICDHCGLLLGDNWQEYKGKKYHPECYKKNYQLVCDICKQPINGKYTKDENGIYHIECYKNYKLPKCDICFRPIEGKYIVDPWGNHAHLYHKNQKTVTCDSCLRIISNRTSNGGYKYSDGRYICGYCNSTSINNSKQSKKIFDEILNYYKKIGITDFPKDIPVYVVDRDRLENVAEKRITKSTKGYTKSEFTLINNIRVSSEYSIFILYGMPELEFKGTLAHELLHVWLNENNIKMSESNTEGFCNLGAALIYEIDQSRHAEILLENMEKDPDVHYGKGYRKMKEKLNKLGWDNLLKKIGKN